MNNNQKMVAVIAIVIIAGLLVTSFPSSLSPQAFTQITINTTPSNCNIVVTGGALTTQLLLSSGTSGMGSFTAPAGIYSAMVSKAGYVSQTVQIVVLVLQSGSITKSVTLATFTPPPPNTYALTIKTNPASCQVNVGGTTKNSGVDGAVYNLSSGTYSATVSKAGYVSQTVSCVINGASLAKTVTLSVAIQPPAPTYTLVIKTMPSNCLVSIGNTEIDSGIAGAIFNNLQSGTYSATVSKAGYVSQTVSCVINGASLAKTVTLSTSPSTPSPTKYNVTITTSIDTGSLSGASVTLTDASGTTVSGITDSNGVTFSLSNGNYTLDITATNYYEHTETLLVTSDITKDVLMIPNNMVVYDLTVTVQSATDKTPIVGAVVDIDGQTITTDSSGQASFKNLESGSKTIKITKQGYADTTQPVDLNTNGQTITILMTKGQATPGFEILTLIVALGITVGLIKYQKRKKK